MRGDLHALLLCALVSLTRATRLEEGVEQLAASQSYTTLKGWCLQETVNPDCDETSIIVVKKAMFNRNSRIKKTECNPFTQGEESCEVNITDPVIKLCNSARTCTVPTSMFRNCNGGPFRQMKIMWECITGDPQTAEADLKLNNEEFEEEEVVQPQLKSQVPKQEHALATVINQEELDEDSIVDDSPAIKQELRHLVPNQRQASGNMARSGDNVDDDEEEQAVRKKKEYVKGIVEKISEDPGIDFLYFRTCYRYTRWWKIYQLSPFARLTSCQGKESCYKVVMPDGTYLTDDNEIPNPAEIYKGDIVVGSDSLWVTWRSGIGLQRNDYNTWGLCLPNKDQIGAVTLFEKMKLKYTGKGGRHAHLLTS